MYTQKLAIIFDQAGVFAFDKFTLQNLATSPFIHHLWGETVVWGTVFILQTSDRLQYFTILQFKLHSFNIQDDRSMSGLLAKSIKKISSHLYGQPVLTFAVRDVVECLNEH